MSYSLRQRFHDANETSSNRLGQKSLKPISSIVDVKPRHGDTWGRWTFDNDVLVLRWGNYEVDLEKCKTAAALCDWIFQIDSHGMDTGDFVEAVGDLLNPQGTLCSGCCGGGRSSDQRLDVKEHLSRTVEPIVRTYLIESPSVKAIKIGKSMRTPSDRLRECQTGNPDKLQLLGALTGDNEKALHVHFGSSRIRGEWFEAQPVLEWWRNKGQFGIMPAQQ